MEVVVLRLEIGWDDTVEHLLAVRLSERGEKSIRDGESEDTHVGLIAGGVADGGVSSLPPSATQVVG